MATGVVCDGCGEDVAYCPCERCMTCENLILATDMIFTDGDGEAMCVSCWEAQA